MEPAQSTKLQTDDSSSSSPSSGSDDDLNTGMQLVALVGQKQDFPPEGSSSLSDLRDEFQIQRPTSTAPVENQQSEVNIVGGEFQGGQLIGSQTTHQHYNMSKKEYVDQRQTTITVTHHHHQLQQHKKKEKKVISSGMKETEGLFQLSDSIRMFKNKPISSRTNIFYGEQVSDITDPRPLAIKFIPYDEKNVREAKLLLKLSSHPNVVSIVHSGITEQGAFKYIYIAMELCHEQNLHDHVIHNKNNNVPFDSQLSIFQAKQLVEGLSYIHSNNVIHRDLKPHNVLLSLDKKSLKIADFGISKPMTRGLTKTKVTNVSAGTDGYRAPETFNNDEISQKADIYSLGLIFYFLWSNGHHAFGDDADDWNSNIKRNRNRDLSQLLVPNVTVYLLEELLESEPGKRPTAKSILNNQVFTMPVDSLMETSPKVPISSPVSFGEVKETANLQTTTNVASTKLSLQTPDETTLLQDPVSASPPSPPASGARRKITDSYQSMERMSSIKPETTKAETVLTRPSIITEPMTIEEMISLRESADKFLKHKQYSSACGILQQLVLHQNDPWEKCEILQQIAECHILQNQPFSEEVEKILSTCQSLHLSPKFIETQADEHVKNSRFVHAYIMCVCSSKMYKTENNPDQAAIGIWRCSSTMDDIIKGMKKEPSLRGIASSYVIPSMYDMLEELRQIKNVSEEIRTENEAKCLNFIGDDHWHLDQYEKSLDACMEGIKLMKNTFTENVEKYKTFGFLHHDAGDAADDLGKYQEAAKYYQLSIAAKQKAEDYSDKETKQESIARTRKALANTQRRMKK